MAKNLFLIVGVASALILGFVIFFRPAADLGEIPQEELEPSEQLAVFMTEKMDYGLKLPRTLAEKRIARALRYAEEYPELAPLALEVVDSLKARLARNAKLQD